MPLIRIVLWSYLVAFPVFPHIVPAQAPTMNSAFPEVEIFHETIGVEVVNIDVVVVDKKGRVVEGLTADDFELRIDGQKVPIANFYDVTSGAKAATVPAPSLLPAQSLLQAKVAAAAPSPVAAPDKEPLHLIVYLDGPYLLPQSRQRLLRDLPAFFAEQVAADTRVMLVIREGSSQVVIPFTTDLSDLLAALEQAKKAPALALRQITARRMALGNIRDIFSNCPSSRDDPCGLCFSHMIEMAQLYNFEVLNERQSAMASLGDLVNALAMLDGKKALLHASDGIEQQGGVDLFHYIGQQLCPNKFTEVQKYFLRQDIGDLTDLVNQANASRVTFYTLETSGMRGFSAASTEYASHRFVPSPQNDLLRISNLQSSLFYMANETGGKAILNANQFAPDLAKLTGEMRSYYSLGYEPQHVGHGRAHRVSVKLPKKKGTNVRYRRTFLHKDPDQLRADKALGAVMFGLTENPLNAVVRAGSQVRSTGKNVQVGLEISVPLAKLALIPRGAVRQGRIKVIIAAPGPKGRTSIRKKEIDISLPGPSDPDGDHQFGVNLELPPGEYRLGVSVWDEISGTGSVLNLPIHVGVQSKMAEQV